jgi:hypothetical protein
MPVTLKFLLALKMVHFCVLGLSIVLAPGPAAAAVILVAPFEQRVRRIAVNSRARRSEQSLVFLSQESLHRRNVFSTGEAECEENDRGSEELGHCEVECCSEEEFANAAAKARGCSRTNNSPGAGIIENPHHHLVAAAN